MGGTLVAPEKWVSEITAGAVVGLDVVADWIVHVTRLDRYWVAQ